MPSRLQLWIRRAGRLVRLLIALDFAAVRRRWHGLRDAVPRQLPETLKPVRIARVVPDAAAELLRLDTAPGTEGARLPRLLIVVPGLERDGAPLSACDLARQWQAEGSWQVTVASPRTGPVADDLARGGVAVEIDPVWQAPSWSPAAHLAGVAAIRARLAPLRPDTILVMTVDLFAVVEAAAGAGVRSVWNIREGEPWRERLADRHETVAAHALGCFAAADAVVFVSQATARVWQDFCGPDTAVHVIRNAPQAPAGDQPECARSRLRADLGLPQEGFVALCVGTLSQRKGQIDLIEAVRRLRRDGVGDVTGALVGGNGLTPPQHAEWTLMAGEAVVMPGQVAEPACWYAAADVLVCASRAEGIPRVSHEAALCGLPIITTPVGGIAEILTDGESARFYPPGAVDSLAQLLLQVRADAGLARRLAAGARAAMERAGTFDVMAQAYETVLRSPAQVPAHVVASQDAGGARVAMAG